MPANSPPPVVDLARQSRCQMDDDGDLHEQILHIEAHIEELTDIIERCRKSESDYASPFGCKLSTRSRSRAVSS
jgi:hypothetical protein